MPWVRFIADFDWRPVRTQLTAYRAGHVLLVTTACAKAAKEAGKAVPATKPKEAADGAGR